MSKAQKRIAGPEYTWHGLRARQAKTTTLRIRVAWQSAESNIARLHRADRRQVAHSDDAICRRRRQDTRRATAPNPQARTRMRCRWPQRATAKSHWHRQVRRIKAGKMPNTRRPRPRGKHHDRHTSHLLGGQVGRTERAAVRPTIRHRGLVREVCPPVVLCGVGSIKRLEVLLVRWLVNGVGAQGTPRRDASSVGGRATLELPDVVQDIPPGHTADGGDHLAGNFCPGLLWAVR